MMSTTHRGRLRVPLTHGAARVRAVLPLLIALYPLSGYPAQQASAFSAAMSTTPNQAHPYVPPSWAQGVLHNVPEHGQLTLANLPTPLYRMNSFSGSDGLNFFIKRDDMSGGPELGGNKIRKLEFLLADALANGYNSVVTIGGEQSNHCRATAAAARMVGLEPHLILRTRRANDNLQEFGYTGNILVDRMVGSTIYTCTPGEYGRVGSNELVKRLCAYLESQCSSNKPYPIPVGGSNGLGSWGYINGADELMQQWKSVDTESLDHVVFACGSGGTAAGITLGIALAFGAADGVDPGKMPIVHAMGVCDDPEYFYDYVAEIADEMGFKLPSGSMTTRDFIRRHLVVHQAKGLGYAASTPEELDFVTKFALDTGIVLDPVYSGKALYHFLSEVVPNDPDSFRGKNILFWHTGGALGLYDKGDALIETLSEVSPVKRLDVYGKGGEGMVTI